MEIFGRRPAASAAPSANGVIKDGSDQSFMTDVIEASQTTPVIVDFWAPWCGPCKTLTPALEAAVKAAGGRVKLVKINVDQNPQIAGQLRVQSIPTVYAFDRGQPVDGFMGAIPASEIAKFIDRLTGPAPQAADIESLIQRAQQSLGANDLGGAAQDFAEALSLDPQRATAIAGLARCYLLGGDIERAREVLDYADETAAKDAEVVGVKAALAYAADAGGAGDPRALAAKLDAAPNDQALRFDLAKALAARGDFAGAVERLLDIVAADREWREGAARAELLKVFEAAGPTSEATKAGRRRLSSILFS